MTRQMTASHAKTHLLAVLDEVAAGEEVVITKHGQPVARLVPSSRARSAKGILEGIASTAVEDDELFSTGAEWENG